MGFNAIGGNIWIKQENGQDGVSGNKKPLPGER